MSDLSVCASCGDVLMRKFSTSGEGSWLECVTCRSVYNFPIDDGRLLVDDAPKRRDAASAAAVPRFLFVADLDVFARRDAKGTLLLELSETVTAAVEQRFERIFHWGRDGHPFYFLLKARPKFTMVDLPSKNVFSSARRLVECLQAAPVALRMPRDVRTLSPFRMQEYIHDPECLVVSTSNSADIGVPVDKPASFQDMAQHRARRSQWT